MAVTRVVFSAHCTKKHIIVELRKYLSTANSFMTVLALNKLFIRASNERTSSKPQTNFQWGGPNIRQLH